MNSKFVVQTVLAILLAAPAYAEEPSWTELNSQVNALYRQGKYSEAVTAAKQSFLLAKEKFGPDHPNVAVSSNNLAFLYQSQASYAEAEPLYKQAMAIRKKIFGSDHSSVAQSMNNLAVLYSLQGRYSEAESLYERALSIREKTLSKNHPRVAQSLNNLALLLICTNERLVESLV